MTQAEQITDELVDLFVKKLKERLGNRLIRIILFGSRARGDYHPDSDYDFLVIVDEVTPEVNEAIDDLSGEFLYEYSKLFPVIAVSEKRFANEKYNPLYMNIRKEGVTL